jgi:hypothetical protein
MKPKLITVLSAMTLFAFAGIMGCARPDEESDELTATEARVEGRSNLEIRLMDAPSYNYEMVNIDIKSLAVYVEPVATGQRPRWVELTTSAGNYNMLKLVNGTDVLLAAQYIPPGRVTQIALRFGDFSNVVVDGRPYGLSLADGQTKILIRTDQVVTSDAVTPIMLDFDVARSVFLRDDGYVLRPVVRGISLKKTGSVHGTVEVVRGSVAIFAESGSFTYTTYADMHSGHFLLRGLPPGTYVVKIFYPGMDAPEIHRGVRVTPGTVTDLSLFP